MTRADGADSWDALIEQRLETIRSQGRWRQIRTLESAAPRTTITSSGREVVSFAGNDYLGLTHHPAVLAAAHRAIDAYGTGSGAARLIVGGRPVHDDLEAALARWKEREAALIFSTGYQANVGLIGALATSAPDLVVHSDELNHASIIDGIRLSKARRLRYRNRDMAHLEEQLQGAADARFRVIVTDGVFSMDGYIAPLPEICDLAERYDALVFVDDSHAVGFVGEHGRGTPELCGVAECIDIYTGTFGKALGGASGGYVSAHSEIVALLRQRSRPYLFSNTVAPAIVAGTLAAIDLLETSTEPRERLRANARLFRSLMEAEQFTLLPGEHPIVPVMFGDAALTARIADEMQRRGVYVTAFSFPVVPHGTARIRVQLSAAHTEEQIRHCVAAFAASRQAVTAPTE